MKFLKKIRFFGWNLQFLEMGLPKIQDNGNMEVGLSLGANNKYRRMDDDSELRNGDDFGEDYDAAQHHRQMERSKTTRKYVFACSVFASLNSVLLGYDVGVMSGAILFIQEDLKITEVQQEEMDNGTGRHRLPARCSRHDNCPDVPSSDDGEDFERHWDRIRVMIAPVYIAEISPTVARGSLTSFPEIFINLGILLGYVSNYVFSGLPAHSNWRVMLAVGIIPSIFIAFALCIIPESPRWLVLQNRVDEARSVLLKTNEHEAEVEERLAEILLAAGHGATVVGPSRRPCGITGIDATVYYSPKIFQAAGIEDKSKLLAATVAVGVTKTAFILIAIVLIDRVGRKPLLYVSTIGMTVCLFSVGVTLSFFGEGSFAVALAILGVCGNVAFFSVGIGPVCWVLTSEIFPLRVRAQASALGAVGNRLCSGFVAMSFLSVAHAITFGGRSSSSPRSLRSLWRSCTSAYRRRRGSRWSRSSCCSRTGTSCRRARFSSETLSIWCRRSNLRLLKTGCFKTTGDRQHQSRD
ncbi:hypothetical protein SASPL_157641 [Salvia splendens]|uniref:Major facilitator superfamily (MFS) profile domain-containing protein n=1 Tax=Salvia splendens TaxID=180675 RepID=A0A8X8YW24_SALSN|nr:hypothetical protein SASPL_157641 [Salvia splendens]